MSTLLIRNIDAVVTCDKEDSMPRGVDLLWKWRCGHHLSDRVRRPPPAGSFTGPLLCGV